MNLLGKVHKKVWSSANHFEVQQQRLRDELQTLIRNTPATFSLTKEKNVSPFYSIWLPGPLSYPWVVMLATLPTILTLSALLGSAGI